MTERKNRVIDEINAAEKEQDKIDKVAGEDKGKQQREIIAEGERAERLEENTDFMFFMRKLTKRVEDITYSQSMRLLNINKLIESNCGAIDDIIKNQMKEAILGGEFKGLKQMSLNIKTAIQSKKSVLEQRENEE